jgi:REP element-mobilizing transposase RayT
LRSEALLEVLTRAIAGSQHTDFRITHFSIQREHVHLLLEASDEAALSTGMRGLTIRMARRMNTALGRRGKVWGDRWHGHTLSTPSEVRRALAYVLMNGRKHGAIPFGLDPCASVVWSHDVLADPVYREGPQQLAAERAAPVAEPRTWLLKTGWRKLGLLRLADAPRRRRSGMR